MASPLNVTIWHEHVHEKKSEKVREVYPDGMHTALKAGLEKHLGNAVHVGTALLEEPEHGLTDAVLEKTDVLTWWGHCAHGQVEDAIVEKVHKRVLAGMGLVVLHSGHYSKIFKKLMGTGCGLKWREAAELERIWCVSPGHPITAGMDQDYLELPHTEMYGEPFDIPEPDELVFVSWFEGGDIFRSGCVFKRGAGKIFYFRPGHETFPLYHNDAVTRIIANGVQYVAPVAGTVKYEPKAPNSRHSLSPIAAKHEVDESLHKH
jgi:trehalose utilization protein